MSKESLFAIQSSKDKIPKDMAYPMKTSQIEGLWMPFRSKIELNINYGLQQNPKIEPFYVFRAHYLLPNENVKNDRVSVYINAVPSEKADLIRKKLEGELLPRFAAWLERLFQLPENSSIFSGKDILFQAEYSNGQLRIFE